MGEQEMNISSIFSNVSGDIATYFAIGFLTFGGLVWYALRVKGDVRAVFSHGKTMLELEAKERKADRKQKPSVRSTTI
jgi:hypothetical protein